MTISNQQFTPEILAHIQGLSDANPGWSRRRLSVQVCEWLQWRSPNGKLKDMSCREEFGAAELGDVRRVKRLQTIGRDFYAQPQANVPQASGTPAKTKAAYRFFDDPYHVPKNCPSPRKKATSGW